MTDRDRRTPLAQRGFRQLNRGMVLLWRLGLGGLLNAGPRVGGRYLVLTHTGRTSGRRYRTPLDFAVVAGRVYCLAGFGPRSDWYLNLLANPSVAVWLPDGRWTGHASTVTDPAVRASAVRPVLVASGFAARFAGLDLAAMSDDQLGAAAQEWPLVCIELTGRVPCREVGG